MTAAELRALAHPLRVQLAQILHAEGPATASQLARRLGESSGATSYHLRVLAGADLVEEDPERGTGRERWWRRVQPIYFPTDAEAPDERALEVSARLLHLERDDEALQRYLRGFDTLPTEWNAAAFTGSFPVYMTSEELLAFGLEWLARVEALRRTPGERPPGARRVLVSLRALPWVGDDPAA